MPIPGWCLTRWPHFTGDSPHSEVSVAPSALRTGSPHLEQAHPAQGQWQGWNLIPLAPGPPFVNLYRPNFYQNWNLACSLISGFGLSLLPYRCGVPCSGSVGTMT